MRAVKCTECGATIHNISDGSRILDCEYCGTRMLLEANQASPRRVVVEPPNFAPDAEPISVASIIGLAGGVVALLSILLVAVSISYRPSLSPSGTVHSAPAAPSAGSPLPWSWPGPEPAIPVPVVNYQPRVSWDGPNDMEYFADPRVDLATVQNKTTEEVKKTVFKDRTVKLKVVINTAGEIDTVETISGHPILVEAATASAKRSIFRSRSKPTTRILTYTFRVLSD